MAFSSTAYRAMFLPLENSCKLHHSWNRIFKNISNGVKQGEDGSGGRLGSIRLTVGLMDFESIF